MAHVVVAHWHAKPGKEERLQEVIAEMTPATRAEPGNQVYVAHRSIEDPLHFMLYEVYDDADALKAHSESEHYQRLVAGEARPELLADRRREEYETL
jgi:quinol monooxygenase YgiN